MPEWHEGIDLRGIPPDEFIVRWYSLTVIARAEIFLYCAETEEKCYCAWVDGHDCLSALADSFERLLISRQTLQGIVDILARFGEIDCLHFAAQYNTAMGEKKK